MKRYFGIKLLSIVVNILTCSLFLLVNLVKPDLFEGTELPTFLAWPVPMALAIALCGGIIIQLTQEVRSGTRVFLFFVIALACSYVGVFSYFFMLPVPVNIFTVPIFYVWFTGLFVQLLFLNWRLHNAVFTQPKPRAALGLLFFPLYVVLGTLLVFSVPLLMNYLSRPEKAVFLLPSDFDGKFRIVFNEKCGAASTFEGGKRVLTIPGNGLLILQPGFMPGGMENLYFKVDKNGSRTEIPQLRGIADISSIPGVVLKSAGSLMPRLADGSVSTDPSSAIYFEDFVLRNDTLPLINPANAVKDIQFDSLTAVQVQQCRARNN